MTANDSNRIDFIDLAKGLCILLVVYFHAAAFVSVSSGMDAMLSSFRMPLYFFLSGLFFKPYEGFRGFLIRKTNKLLIPFAFFYLTTSVILPYIFWKFLGHTINTVVGIESLWAFINLETFPNVPIWFLWCLFLLNLFFYGLYLLSSKTRHPLRMLSLLCLGAGLIGFSCLFFHVNLYAFIDEALEAMPFFCCGYLLRQYSIQAPAGIFNILKSNPERKGRYMTESIIGIALLAAYTYLMTSFQTENYFLRLWIRYSCGIGGTLMVIFIARLLKRLPLISYFGRYSIMILCTHVLLIQIVVMLCGKFLPAFAANLWVIMPLVMLPYLLLIPLMKRVIPWFTAQKDLIKLPPNR